MNVLSVFDGISCAQEALNRSGIKVNNYYSSEVDKYSIWVTQKNHPNTIQLSDVQGVRAKDLPTIDLLIGGSPCQGFSFAGKQLNFQDSRSKLFFEFVRLLKELKTLNPDVKFLLENVRMKKEYQDVITDYMGVDPTEINSAIFSAQNRKRLYWTNIPIKKLPEDKGILLKNIIGHGYVDRQKSFCLDASYYKGGNEKQYFQKSRRQLVFLSESELERAKEKYKAKIWKSGNRMGNMVFPDSMEKKSKTISSTVIKGSRETVHIKDKKGIRILTPIECERLQTLPDNYTKGVSNTQRYKMIGNGFTVDVIAHILEGIKPQH